MDELISRHAAIKDAESWVAVDEYEKHLQKNVVEWLKEFPAAELGTNLAQLGTDCISRQAAIDALVKALNPHLVTFVRAKNAIEQLPTIQHEISIEQIKIWLDAWEGYIDKDIIERMKYRVIDIPLVNVKEVTK